MLVQTKEERSRTASSHSFLVNREQFSQMRETLNGYLTESKPYLRQRYSLKELAEDTKYPLHHLSAFINNYYGMNFNDFINQYRVEFCRGKIMNQEGRFKKLEALAEESGFNNRNTFAAAFRKVTGQSPSQFLKFMNSVNYEVQDATQLIGEITYKCSA
jgi:AraC-like DNA-binding protein